MSGRKWVTRVVLTMVALAGLAVVAAVVADRAILVYCRMNLRSPDPARRRRELERVSYYHEARAMPELLNVLATEQDRGLLELAGRATMRTRDPSGVAPLQRRADEEPDDAVRANLIYYAARLSDRDLRLLDWLTAGARSAEPWRRAGSAAGLLDLGQPDGGLLLIERAGDVDPAIRAFALEHLRKTAGPVTETIGRPIAWPTQSTEPLDEAFLAGARTTWQHYVTVQLLNDVLNRLRYRDPQWYEIGRLAHARERFAWLFK